MKFVFWTILVSFGLSIFNICAMKKEEVPQNPQSASEMAGPGATPSPVRIAQPQIPQGTPLNAAAAKSMQGSQSAKSVIVPTPNYCSEIIGALNSDNPKLALELIYKFYAKIPSELKNFIIKGQTNQRRIDASINFHLSLFFLIALSIEFGSTEERADGTISLQNTKIIFADQKIILNLKNINNQIYEIKFDVKPVLDEGEKFKKIDFNVTITKKRDLSRDIVAVLASRYITNNIMKNTTLRFVYDQPKKLKLVEEAAAAIDVTIDDSSVLDEILSTRLTSLFNCIPKKIQINYERYYHFIIYSLIKLMGSEICHAEYYVGEGRADLILQTSNISCIVEFKCLDPEESKDGKEPVTEALAQIESQHYTNFFDEPVKISGVNIRRIGDQIKVTCSIKTGIPLVPKIETPEAEIFSMDFSSTVPMITKKRDVHVKSEEAPEMKKRKEAPQPDESMSDEFGDEKRK